MNRRRWEVEEEVDAMMERIRREGARANLLLPESEQKLHVEQSAPSLAMKKEYSYCTMLNHECVYV